MQPPPLRLAYLADPNSIHTRRWVGFFASRGHEVHLLIGMQDDVRGSLPDGVRLHRYRRFGARRLPLLSSLQGRSAIRALLVELRPDVLHAHYLSRFGWQARLSGFHPYVVTPWGSDLFVTMPRSLRARLWARWTLGSADLVTAASIQMRDAVIAAGARPDRVVPLRFGVDTDRFAPGEADGAVRAALGAEGRIIFSPRSLRPLYRHDTVLDAFARLPGDLVLVMGARNADAAERRRIEAQAARLGIADRIRILADIGDDQMLALYRTARAVISVPESDGLPLTVLEAMACGTPVIASDLLGVREMLGPVAPRLLVATADAASLARAVEEVLQAGAADRAALGTALRERVVAEADQRVNLLRMEQHYRELALAG